MTGKHLIAGAKRCSLVYLFLALLALSPALAASEFQIASNSVVVLADVDAARKALRIEDDFIRALSEFDRGIADEIRATRFTRRIPEIHRGRSSRVD